MALLFPAVSRARMLRQGKPPWVFHLAARTSGHAPMLCGVLGTSSPIGSAPGRRDAEVLVQELGSGLDRRVDVAVVVVQVDMLLAVQPDNPLRPGHALMRLAGSVRGTVGVLDAVHDQAGLRTEEVSADHVVHR